jgi:membrane protein DedA with SNARE-associated domain
MGTVQGWLSSMPPELIYVLVAAVIGMESLGVPLPGEIALVSAALLSVTGVTNVVWVAVAGSLGAIIGDSIGYAIGWRGGRQLLIRLGRRFPTHLGPPQLARAEKVFARWGVWAIFFGRFVALLRILAGPLSGALRVHYRKFLMANAAGGICWAAGTTFAVYELGRVAEKWLSNISYVALGVAVVFGIGSTLYLRHRSRLEAAQARLGQPATDPAAPEQTADPAQAQAPSPAQTANQEPVTDLAKTANPAQITGPEQAAGPEQTAEPDRLAEAAGIADRAPTADPGPLTEAEPATDVGRPAAEHRSASDPSADTSISRARRA